MNPAHLKMQLRGVIAFTPTPFLEDERVDFDGLAQQVDFLCQSGASVLVVCGGVGEFASLELDEYRSCITAALDAAAGSIPVMVGVGHSTRIACALAEHAAHRGAAGIMVNPLYFIEPSQDGVVSHYRAIASASGLGLMIFSTRGSLYLPPLIERLAEIEEVVALKDEFGDLRLFVDIKTHLGDRLAWINGMAEPLAAAYFAAGAQAFTSGLINFVPELTMRVWELGKAGRWNELESHIAGSILPLARLREKRKGYSIAVIKEAMNQMGLPGGFLRAPLGPMTPSDRIELQVLLNDLNLLSADSVPAVGDRGASHKEPSRAR
jgi:5-dehydro-4-deoxyglucarate dehydratase